jgi:hypothetical protein
MFGRRRVLLVALAATLVLGACGSTTRNEPTPEAAVTGPPDSLPPLDRPPLDPPIKVTATFGEYRRLHFHAGLDFSTEHQIGRPVFAPVAGYIERARTSGAGFGRSLMIHTADGRTILLAHLDAFDEPIASYVAHAQDSTGRYEQELSPPPGLFPVKVGQRIAWTGDSGAGPPHLHMEVRYGEWAYNPLRFGLAIPDSAPPVLHRVILEPIDDVSTVEGGSAPVPFAFPRDTVTAEGRLRVWVEAGDGITDPEPRDAPYGLSMEWNGASVECRFDRIAWDDDMVAAEWVYDGRGTISTRHSVALWSSPAFRPSMLHLSAEQAGVVTVAPNDPPHALTIAARDAAGNRTEQRIVLRPPPPHAPATVAPPAAPQAVAGSGADFEVIPVQGPFVRIHYSGLAHGSRELMLGLAGRTLELRTATLSRRHWSAVVRVPDQVTAIVATGSGTSGAWEERRPWRLATLEPDSESTISAAGFGVSYRWTFPRHAAFSPIYVSVDSLAPAHASPALAPGSPILTLGPPDWPLRRAARIEVQVAGAAPPHSDLYMASEAAWNPARSETASSAPSGQAITGEALTLGRIAVFQDVSPPHVGLARATRLRTPAPDHWALQCAIVERGSGLDLDATYFTVDGRRVPSEWDPEHGVLRWRPLHAPAAGSHEYEVRATDRAGLESRSRGRFVIR